VTNPTAPTVRLQLPQNSFTMPPKLLGVKSAGEVPSLSIPGQLPRGLDRRLCRALGPRSDLQGLPRLSSGKRHAARERSNTAVRLTRAYTGAGDWQAS
jgi:hypothetical protein